MALSTHLRRALSLRLHVRWLRPQRHALRAEVAAARIPEEAGLRAGRQAPRQLRQALPPTLRRLHPAAEVEAGVHTKAKQGFTDS